MTPIQNISDDKIDHEIWIRETIIVKLVGNLYPSILQGEIEILKERKQYLKEQQYLKERPIEFLSDKEMEI